MVKYGMVPDLWLLQGNARSAEEGTRGLSPALLLKLSLPGPQKYVE